MHKYNDPFWIVSFVIVNQRTPTLSFRLKINYCSTYYWH